MKISSIIITVVLGLIGIVVAISNRQPVVVRLDPTSETAPVLFLGPLPLFYVIFGSIGIGLILGGLSVWISQGRWRRRAWREYRHARKLEREAAKTAKAAKAQSAASADPKKAA